MATDLRVSLTDLCNLRCTYCMPAEGLEWMPTEQALTDDEVAAGRVLTCQARPTSASVAVDYDGR